MRAVNSALTFAAGTVAMCLLVAPGALAQSLNQQWVDYIATSHERSVEEAEQEAAQRDNFSASESLGSQALTARDQFVSDTFGSRRAQNLSEFLDLGRSETSVRDVIESEVDLLVVGASSERTNGFPDVALLIKTSAPVLEEDLREFNDLFNREPITRRFAPERGICSAVFVSDTTLLTAAHCVCLLRLDTELGSSETMVLWGDDVYELGKGRQFSPQPYNHAALSIEFLPELRNPQICDVFRETNQIQGIDVALVHLRETHVKLIAETTPLNGSRRRPTQFAWPELYLSANLSHMTVVGYGHTTVPPSEDPGIFAIKVAANIPVTDAYCGDPRVARAVNCRAGEEIVLIDQVFGNDTCRGDSGGPAFVRYYDRYYLAGITSRAVSPVGLCGTGGIYSLLTPRILSWIRLHARTYDPTF